MVTQTNNFEQITTGRMAPISERLPAHIVASAALRANGDERLRDEYLDWYERGQVDEYCRSRRVLARDQKEALEEMAVRS